MKESDCEICQCLQNQYSCDRSACAQKNQTAESSPLEKPISYGSEGGPGFDLSGGLGPFGVSVLHLSTTEKTDDRSDSIDIAEGWPISTGSKTLSPFGEFLDHFSTTENPDDQDTSDITEGRSILIEPKSSPPPECLPDRLSINTFKFINMIMCL